MGKGDKLQGKGGCAFKRINYLYQAAQLTLRQNPKKTEMVRFYAHTLKSIAKREVLRLHPDMKRSLCKKCFMLLVPGVTSTVRIRGNRHKHTVVTCMDCGTVKRFIANKDYVLHVDKPEFIASQTVLSHPASQHQPCSSQNKTQGTSVAKADPLQTQKIKSAHPNLGNSPSVFKKNGSFHQQRTVSDGEAHNKHFNRL